MTWKYKCPPLVMFRPSYLMNISRVSEDGLFHSLLSVISRAIHHTGRNIIKRKLFWTRLHSYPRCGVWESNRRIQHFNQVWYESFPWSFYQDSSWTSCPGSSLQQKLKLSSADATDVPKDYECSASQQSVIGLGVGCWELGGLIYKKSKHNFQRQNNQICVATITEWGQS